MQRWNRLTDIHSNSKTHVSEPTGIKMHMIKSPWKKIFIIPLCICLQLKSSDKIISSFFRKHLLCLDLLYGVKMINYCIMERIDEATIVFCMSKSLVTYTMSSMINTKKCNQPYITRPTLHRLSKTNSIHWNTSMNRAKGMKKVSCVAYCKIFLYNDVT